MILGDDTTDFYCNMRICSPVSGSCVSALFSFHANFARAVKSSSMGKDNEVARFLPNPERHWGPKLRAGRQISGKHVSLLGTKRG